MTKDRMLEVDIDNWLNIRLSKEQLDELAQLIAKYIKSPTEAQLSTNSKGK